MVWYITLKDKLEAVVKSVAILVRVDNSVINMKLVFGVEDRVYRSGNMIMSPDRQKIEKFGLTTLNYSDSSIVVDEKLDKLAMQMVQKYMEYFENITPFLLEKIFGGIIPSGNIFSEILQYILKSRYVLYSEYYVDGKVSSVMEGFFVTKDDLISYVESKVQLDKIEKVLYSNEVDYSPAGVTVAVIENKEDYWHRITVKTKKHEL